MQYELSEHARKQFEIRGIDIDLVFEILDNSDHIITGEEYDVYQSIRNIGKKKYLFRIFVNTKKDPPLVITGYRTSKIEKYHEGTI